MFWTIDFNERLWKTIYICQETCKLINVDLRASSFLVYKLKEAEKVFILR